MRNDEKAKVLFDLAKVIGSAKDRAKEEAEREQRHKDRLRRHDERFGIRRGMTIEAGIPEDRDD